MRLIDTNDPAARRKAAKHYERMARHAQRQRRWRNRREWLTRRHFAFADMIAVGLLAALFAAGLTYLLIR